MKIAIWHTGHQIADIVSQAVFDGLNAKADRYHSSLATKARLDLYDAHIGYGILRGMADVYLEARGAGKPFLCLDNGYWKPGHYDGYYRISLNGTQQTTGLDKLEPDYERWDALGLPILTRQLHEADGRVLICPPTSHVIDFFSIKSREITPHPKLIIRTKESGGTLQKDLDKCCMVRTFNSSVGWEALRQGIPVISDPNHSFVGAYQKQVDKLPSLMDIDARRRMFAIMASLQLTLEEIRQGKLWPLIQKLLASAGPDRA